MSLYLRLSHPNVCRLLQAFVEKTGEIWLCMELCAGGDETHPCASLLYMMMMMMMMMMMKYGVVRLNEKGNMPLFGCSEWRHGLRANSSKRPPSGALFLHLWSAPRDVHMAGELFELAAGTSSVKREGACMLDTEARIAVLVKQMAAAIRYMHSMGMVHRDIKLPAPIMSS